jgi:hypothetical protein
VPDLLDVIVARGEAETKKLEEAGVAHKEVKEDAGETPPEKPSEKVPTETSEDEVEAVARRVAEIMGVPELSKMLEGFQGDFKDFAKRLEQIEKGDVERLEEKERWQPQALWLRASKAEHTILDETKDKELGGKKPKVPAAIQAVTEMVAGRELG